MNGEITDFDETWEWTSKLRNLAKKKIKEISNFPKISNLISCWQLGWHAVCQKVWAKSSQILENPERPTSKHFWKPKISTSKLCFYHINSTYKLDHLIQLNFLIIFFQCNRRKFKVLKIWRWSGAWNLLTLTHFGGFRRFITLPKFHVSYRHHMRG